ncbi:MAG: ribonuclease HII [Anaerolineales bacterium]|nr:ribonuclease HII [Anaerolineales bacterium]
MTRRFDPALLPPAPDLSLESALWEHGVSAIAGIDEAGRGALAGPVAAGAVILPAEPEIAEELHGVNDSKKMTPKQREIWAATIKETALAWGLGFASNQEIDEIGIIPATRLAAWRALEQLAIPPTFLLIDALLLPDHPLPQTSLLKGDARSLSIAAASVIAKVGRDGLMCDLDRKYPAYGLAAHKGYGTAFHRAVITEHGPCPLHRMTFAPMREVVESM